MKNNTPLIAIIVAIILLAGLGLLLNKGAEPAPLPESATGTTTESGAPLLGANETVPPAPNSPATITTQIIWKYFQPEGWALEMRYKVQEDWKVSLGADKDGDTNQVSIGAPEGSIMVTKDLPIAEPARLTAKTYTRTIAGQQMEVREYMNPNETYAYYLFFTINADDDKYYVSVKSFGEAEKFATDFISRLVIK